MNKTDPRGREAATASWLQQHIAFQDALPITDAGAAAGLAFTGALAVVAVAPLVSAGATALLNAPAAVVTGETSLAAAGGSQATAALGANVVQSASTAVGAGLAAAGQAEIAAAAGAEALGTATAQAIGQAVTRQAASKTLQFTMEAVGEIQGTAATTGRLAAQEAAIVETNSAASAIANEARLLFETTKGAFK